MKEIYTIVTDSKLPIADDIDLIIEVGEKIIVHEQYDGEGVWIHEWPPFSIWVTPKDARYRVDQNAMPQPFDEAGKQIVVPEQRNNSTHKCPICGTKCLDATCYCVKCKKKHPKKEMFMPGWSIAVPMSEMPDDLYNLLNSWNWSTRDFDSEIITFVVKPTNDVDVLNSMSDRIGNIEPGENGYDTIRNLFKRKKRSALIYKDSVKKEASFDYSLIKEIEKNKRDFISDVEEGLFIWLNTKKGTGISNGDIIKVESFGDEYRVHVVNVKTQKLFDSYETYDKEDFYKIITDTYYYYASSREVNKLLENCKKKHVKKEASFDYSLIKEIEKNKRDFISDVEEGLFIWLNTKKGTGISNGDIIKVESFGDEYRVHVVNVKTQKLFDSYETYDKEDFYKIITDTYYYYASSREVNKLLENCKKKHVKKEASVEDQITIKKIEADIKQLEIDKLETEDTNEKEGIQNRIDSLKDRIEGMKESLKEAKLSREVMDVVDKYEKKDYWGDKEAIERKIQEWEHYGKPEPHTPKSIEEALIKMFREKRIEWVEGMVKKFLDKDEKYIRDVLRYDQVFTKEIFSAVTGIAVKKLSTKNIQPVIDEYIKESKLKEGRSFDDWIDLFLSEKGISPDTDIEVEGDSGTNYMTVGVIVEFMKMAPAREQKGIKDMMVRIDFKNGDVLDYIKHLAKALAR